jgi:hypothetical protein
VKNGAALPYFDSLIDVDTDGCGRVTVGTNDLTVASVIVEVYGTRATERARLEFRSEHT